MFLTYTAMRSVLYGPYGLEFNVMRELIRRLLARPGIFSEMMVASFFANVMALASPLFVMQVLNRYVGQGVDATLVTLTSGVLIGIALALGKKVQKILHGVY